MIMIFENAMTRPPSVDCGRSGLALGLVDQRCPVVEVILLVEARRQRRRRPRTPRSSSPSRRAALIGRSTRVTRWRRTSSVISRVCSSSAIAFGRRLEQDDLVRALTVAIDGVRQSAATPGRDLHDLPAGGHDLAGGPVDEGLALVIRHVRADHEHEFIAAHTRRCSFQWVCPVDGRAGTERKGRGAKSSTRSAGGPRRAGTVDAPDRPPLYPPSTIPTEPVQPVPTAEASCPQAPSCFSRANQPATRRIAQILVRRRLPGHPDGRSGRGHRPGSGPPAPRHRRRRPGPAPRSRSAPRCDRHRTCPRCRSCASARATTSRSGSASSRPGPTT